MQNLITDIVIEMDTVEVTNERCSFRFFNVYHTTSVPNQYQLIEIYYLQQTLCLDIFSNHQQMREIWNN